MSEAHADRCRGECCLDFVMENPRDPGSYLSPDDLRDFARVLRDEGKEDAAREIEGFAARLVEKYTSDAGVTHWTCKEFDVESEACLIYDERPGVCRRYGTPEVPCNHAGCQWKGAARGPAISDEEIAP